MSRQQYRQQPQCITPTAAQWCLIYKRWIFRKRLSFIALPRPSAPCGCPALLLILPCKVRSGASRTLRAPGRPSLTGQTTRGTQPPRRDEQTDLKKLPHWCWASLSHRSSQRADMLRSMSSRKKKTLSTDRDHMGQVHWSRNRKWRGLTVSTWRQFHGSPKDRGLCWRTDQT